MNHPETVDKALRQDSQPLLWHTKEDLEVQQNIPLILLLCCVSCWYAWTYIMQRSTVKRRVSNVFTPSRFTRLLVSIYEKSKHHLLLTKEEQKLWPRVFTTLLDFKQASLSTQSLQFVGLYNRGNSCYQNSILQSLACLSAFRQFLGDNTRKDVEATTHFVSSNVLYGLLTCLAEGTRSSSPLDVPPVLNLMQDLEQQDAQEYLSTIFEVISKEIKTYALKKEQADAIQVAQLMLSNDSQPSTTQVAKPLAEGYNNDWKVDLARKSLANHIKPPLNGTVSQVVRCLKCGDGGGPQVTEFNCLTLNLISWDDQSIEDLIDEHMKPELIDALIECDVCTQVAGMGVDTKVRSAKAKQQTFGALPKDLVIHINRSTINASRTALVKNTGAVNFRMLLSIPASWTTNFVSSTPQVQAVYELRAVITHRGDHRTGHYMAFGKRSKDWYRFNDEHVRNSSEEEVLRQTNVFMLSYEKLDFISNLDAPLNSQSSTDTKYTDFRVPQGVRVVTPIVQPCVVTEARSLEASDSSASSSASTNSLKSTSEDIQQDVPIFTGRIDVGSITMATADAQVFGNSTEDLCKLRERLHEPITPHDHDIC